MDFSIFSDDNFDVKEWVNTAFQCEEAMQNKEAYAGTLVMKLQLFIQEINNSLEETGQQVLQNLPRVLRDVEAIQQESILLRDQMRAIKEDIKKVEHDTAQSMQALVKIDTIKNRMLETNKALQEADNWTSLSSDVEEVFGRGDVNKIVENLVGMQQSLEILVDVPDFEDRCQHLEKLKDRLEALISPQLIAALNSDSQDVAQMYLGMFKDIDRIQQFWNYYHKCRKAQLLAEWKKIVEKDQDETVVDWLTAFYDKLLSTWHGQARWCQHSNTSYIATLCNIFSDVLANLSPTRSYCIESAIKEQSASNTLFLLFDVKQISEGFAKSIQSVINESDQSSNDTVKEFALSIYEPLKEHIAQFSKLQEKILSEKVSSLNMLREDSVDSVRQFGYSVNKVITCIKEVNEHCQRLTMGCSYPSVIAAITGFFRDYSKEVTKVVAQLKEQAEANFTGDDWSVFQQALQATQFCGDLLNKIENIEQDILSSILETGRQENISAQNEIINQETACYHGNAFTDYKHLLLTEGGEKQLRSLVVKVQQDSNVSVIPEVIKSIQNLCEKFCKLLFNIMFDPINKQLGKIPTLGVWSEKSSGGALTSDLPTFSFSPQEYITQIGQHLITLPQHIEPFVVDDNPALSLALKNGKLPYIMDQNSSHLADVLLGSLAQGTTQTYCETIIRINQLTSASTKQLITDIDYLFNVLDDLGLKPGDVDPLQVALKLLEAGRDQFSIVSHSKPAHLVSAIRRMRNI